MLLSLDEHKAWWFVAGVWKPTYLGFPSDSHPFLVSILASLQRPRASSIFKILFGVGLGHLLDHSVLYEAWSSNHVDHQLWYSATGLAWFRSSGLQCRMTLSDPIYSLCHLLICMLIGRCHHNFDGSLRTLMRTRIWSEISSALQGRGRGNWTRSKICVGWRESGLMAPDEQRKFLKKRGKAKIWVKEQINGMKGREKRRWVE